MLKTVLKINIAFLLAAALLFLANTAAHAASYYFSPAVDSFVQGCVNEVVVMVDTAGVDSNAADIEITYDPTKIEVQDANLSLAGVQVTPGDAYEAYFFNLDTGGNIKIAAGSFLNLLNGAKTFIRIPFKSLGVTAAAGFTINFTGSGDTLDSNIAEETTSLDLLTSVTNGSYTFTAGGCISDTTPPTITNNYPQNGNTGIPSNAVITVTVADTGAGVDLATVEVIINGITYKNGDAGVVVTGSPASYVFNVDPAEDIPQGNASVVVVNADDLAGNSATKIISFNIPPGVVLPPSPGDIIPPEIIKELPLDNIDINLQSLILLNLTDNMSGINLNSLVMVLNGTQFTILSPEVTYSGNLLDYMVTLDPPDSLLLTATNFLVVFVKDNAGNASIKTLAFNTRPDLLPETGECITPTPGAPQQCEEVPPTDIIERVNTVINTINQQLPPELANSVVPALLIALSAAGFLVNFLVYPQLLIYLFSWLTRRFAKTPWGIVYNNVTKQPIAFATVRLYKHGKLYRETITDLEGRYKFPIETGEYIVQTVHSDYKESKIDVVIVDLEDLIKEDIPLTPKLAASTARRISFKDILKKNIKEINGYIIYTGFLLSVFALILAPTLLNFLVFTLYLVGFVIATVIRIRRRRPWGYVVESANGRAVPSAFVRIYDKLQGRQVDVQITDNLGRYSTRLSKGRYLLNVDVPNYAFPSKKSKGVVTGKAGTKFIQADVKQTKDLNVDLEVDPAAFSGGSANFGA